MGIISYFANKTILKETIDFLKVLMISTDDEISELILMSTVLREDLISKNIITENTFDNLSLIYGDQEKEMLRLKLVMYMNKVLIPQNNPSYVAGLKVWVMTLRVLINADCAIEVKNIWHELDRGFKNLDNIVYKLENNGVRISEWTKLNMHYRPNI